MSEGPRSRALVTWIAGPLVYQAKERRVDHRGKHICIMMIHMCVWIYISNKLYKFSMCITYRVNNKHFFVEYSGRSFARFYGPVYVYVFKCVRMHVRVCISMCERALTSSWRCDLERTPLSLCLSLSNKTHIVQKSNDTTKIIFNSRNVTTKFLIQKLKQYLMCQKICPNQCPGMPQMRETFRTFRTANNKQYTTSWRCHNYAKLMSSLY